MRDREIGRERERSEWMEDGGGQIGRIGVSRTREIGHGRRDRSNGGKLQAATRSRRREFDLEGGGNVLQAVAGFDRRWAAIFSGSSSLSRFRKAENGCN